MCVLPAFSMEVKIIFALLREIGQGPLFLACLSLATKSCFPVSFFFLFFPGRVSLCNTDCVCTGCGPPLGLLSVGIAGCFTMPGSTLALSNFCLLLLFYGQRSASLPIYCGTGSLCSFFSLLQSLRVNLHKILTSQAMSEILPLCFIATSEISHSQDSLTTNSCPSVSQLLVASTLWIFTSPFCFLGFLFFCSLHISPPCLHLPASAHCLPFQSVDSDKVSLLFPVVQSSISRDWLSRSSFHS